MEFVGACVSSEEAFTGGGGEPKKQSALGRKKKKKKKQPTNQTRLKVNTLPSTPGLKHLSSFAAKTKFCSV